MNHEIEKLEWVNSKLEESQRRQEKLEESQRRPERQDEALARNMHENMRNEPVGKQTRARREGSRKKSGYYVGQCPILIKRDQGHYEPWAAQDLEGLVARLPDPREGAGK